VVIFITGGIGGGDIFVFFFGERRALMFCFLIVLFCVGAE
jgi:hypothetical protein